MTRSEGNSQHIDHLRVASPLGNFCGYLSPHVIRLNQLELLFVCIHHLASVRMRKLIIYISQPQEDSKLQPTAVCMIKQQRARPLGSQGQSDNWTYFSVILESCPSSNFLF